MKEKRGFIFDFDGVVMDTEKYHYQSWSEAFESVGSSLSEKEYIPLKSIGRDYIMTFVENRDGINFTPSQKEKIVTTKDTRYREMKLEFSLADEIPGVFAYLDFLKSQGKKIAVASSSIEACNTIKQFGLEDKFDAVVDGTFGLKRKPNPDMFQYASKKIGIPPEECIVFEDSIAGVTASKNAEMQCVYIGEINNKNAVETISNFINYNRTSF